MLGRQFDALLEAAEADGGVDFDGLRVVREGAGDASADGGYTFATPEHEATGLSESELHAHADGSPYVTNWHFWEREVRRHDSPRRAFLRLAEGAIRDRAHGAPDLPGHGPDGEPADEDTSEGDGTRGGESGEHGHDDGDSGSTHGAQPVPERYDALADGLTTEWGQLRIEVSLDPDGDDGVRRYDVRHVDDAGRPTDELETHGSPLDAREIATYDDDGRYRPLKTAPSLRTGWAFPDLGWRDAVETVELFYPATVANWYREREGTLDVDHWEEATGRQTGIYGIVSELPREAVEWVAEAACDDSQCLKRREWQYSADDELAADGGAGVFPCREPCSLVVAASRRWTKLEEEEPREYTFRMTPSEKEQLEGVVDAVADGRVDEIREADVYEDANRYRTRYLRAKLFDEHGNLGGVPTEPEADGEHARGHDGGHGNDDDDQEEHDAADHGEDEDGHDEDEGGHDGHDGEE